MNELLADTYVNRSPGSPDMPRDRSGVAGIVDTMRRAFPDLHYAVEEIVPGPETVAVRLTVTGTHLGEFFGLAATGRSFSVSQINLERVVGGRIAEHHRVTDELSLMRQLGAL